LVSSPTRSYPSPKSSSKSRRLVAKRTKRSSSPKPLGGLLRADRKARRGSTLTTLCESRIEDLQRLLELRGMEKLPPGGRNEWMYVAAVSLSYLVASEALEKRMIELGREYAGWSAAETRSCISTVLRKARSAAEGETLEWKGQQRGPRYWLTNEEIIRRLKITPDEQRHLKTIISKDTKKQRDRERKEKKRRSEGVAPREEYLAECRESRQHNRHLAKELKAQGMSLREIQRISQKLDG